jgi:hypothetical protein
MSKISINLADLYWEDIHHDKNKVIKVKMNKNTREINMTDKNLLIHHMKKFDAVLNK